MGKIGSYFLFNGEKRPARVTREYENRQYHRIFEDLTKAIELFGEAIENKSAKAHAFYHRARAHRNECRYTRAINDTTEAIKIDPNFAAAFDLRGYAKRAIGDIKGADADSARAEQLRR
jgi:tetratricopeptide (TPR) repeat protein